MIVIHPRNARRLESEGMFAIGIAYRVGRGVKSDKPEVDELRGLCSSECDVSK
jgi:hypothetical protein